MAETTPKSYSADPTLYLYTSLTAGSSHIITATSRLETILKANKIPFRALDVATDEKARMLWGRRSKGKKLPGLVKFGSIVGVRLAKQPKVTVTLIEYKGSGRDRGVERVWRVEGTARRYSSCQRHSHPLHHHHTLQSALFTSDTRRITFDTLSQVRTYTNRRAF